jgi:hypothetical protein
VPRIDHPETGPSDAAAPRRSRRRVLAYVAVLSAASAGLAAAGSTAPALAGADTSDDSSTSSSIDAEFFLPEGTASATYTCGGADAGTQALLGAAGLASFPVGAVITSNPVASVQPGEEQPMTFYWTFTLPQNVASVAVGLGIPEFLIGNGVSPMNATEGATGQVAGTAEPHVLPLGDGTQPVSYLEGPYTGTVTRTAAIGEQIVFTPGDITTFVLAPTELDLACVPAQVSPMVLVDQEGAAPPPTAPPTIPTLPTASTTPTTAVADVAGDELPRTGGFDLELAAAGLGLVALGYGARVTARRRTRDNTGA